ncbi:MAG: T9SS type A sorting domain-containing protein [Chlorobi bacterium]|nr:T9SS type A sorting domain-containing protein [Chlorobiota bacterium]
MENEISAGTHQVQFNATNLPSGTYFYQLRAGGFIQTKKCLLIK